MEFRVEMVLRDLAIKGSETLRSKVCQLLRLNTLCDKRGALIWDIGGMTRTGKDQETVGWTPQWALHRGGFRSLCRERQN